MHQPRGEEIPPETAEDVWETIWNAPPVTSDYSLKYLAFMEAVQTTLPRHATVLEAGCGTGQTLSLFCPVHTAVGLDISRNALVLAKTTCTTVLQGDIFSIPLRDGSCDLVYNSGVIEHFPEPRNRDAVSEMARVTKRGGRVVIIVPNSLCPWYRFGKSVSVMLRHFEFGYEEDYSLQRLVRTAGSCGLRVIGAFGLQALPPLATHSRELLPLPIRRRLSRIEEYFPGKQYYAYAVGIVAEKA